MPTWLSDLLPIALLLVVILVVVRRLPKIDVGHSDAFKRRRLMNWLPLGLTYACLYMGRYNLSANASQLATLQIIDKVEYAHIDGWGSAVYGFAFLINGPLADRWGGRATILIAAGGSAIINFALGMLIHAQQAGTVDHATLVTSMTVLFSLNMYVQSFGAVSIVKVNASWFHVRERGMLGGIFGILISLGLYFAYDWTRAIGKALPMQWAFEIPAFVLVAFFVIDYFLVRDTPSKAGYADFDTADASSGDTSTDTGVLDVAKRMFSQPVIWIIVAVEFCSGFLRNAVMKWYLVFANETGVKSGFVATNWGVLLCIAGITGGIFAGTISDHVFGSRRGPVAAVLYGGLVVSSIVLIFLLGGSYVGWVVVFMSVCVIGVHGMLSGTASMDFGGKKHAGIATGIIDGFVYLGTAVQSFLYGGVLPTGAAAKDALAWMPWPMAMVPVAIIGFLLATRLWNARPQKATAAAAH